MGAAHLAASNVYRGGHDTLHTQHVHQQADPRHVGHRVQAAHLVEVDLLHRRAVGVALSLRNQAVDRLRIGPYRLGQLQMAQQMADLPHSGVVVMSMVVVVMVVLVFMAMFVLVAVLVTMLMAAVVMVDVPLRGYVAADLLLPVYRHRHMGAGDAAFDGRYGGHRHAGQAQAVHLLQKGCLVVHKLQQGRHEHIAGGPHTAVQIECSHFCFPPMWLIMLAR